MKSSSYVAAAPSFSHPIAAAAWSIIAGLAGRLFVVYFTKRTTGETRRMVCYYSPAIITRRPWNPADKNLLQVWDAEAGAPRFVSMDAVERIVSGGSTFYPVATPKAPAGPEAPSPAEVLALMFA